MSMRTSIKHSYIIFVLSFTVACSSNKMALNNQNEDNVYVSTARAKEGQPYIRQIIEQSQQAIARDEVRENTYSDANSYTDPYLDDISYTARITRFRNYSPWRNYFDPWYDFGYDPFFYNYSIYQDRFLWRNMPSWSFNLNIGPSYFWNDPFYNPWLFRSPFLRYNYWDMYSFYRPFPYPPYYGGQFGNPWGGPFYPTNPRINRPRPGRGFENMNPTGSERIRHSGSRADRYGDSSPSSRSNPGTGSNGARPARTQENNPTPRQNSGNSSGESRPTRTERYNPPSPPASSSRGGDSSGESKARPSRGGGIR